MAALEKFQAFLRELFQLDLADLDFGIYRLLHIKHDEIADFLNEQLPRRVMEAFERMAGDAAGTLKAEIDELAAKIREDVADDAILETGAINPDFQLPATKAAKRLLSQYAEKWEKLKSIQASETEQNDVFNHLYAFFSRYYDNGDFIPRRRYGAREAYAVPYNGEETLFHWANRDQHYVKTGERFRDYAFTVDTPEGACHIRFCLTDANLPPGNTKGEYRYFFPLPEQLSWESGDRTAMLPFHYRPANEADLSAFDNLKNSRLQEAILAAAITGILNRIDSTPLRACLSEPTAQGIPDSISLLEKRLRHFCRKNTSDYFIHKDLSGFLNRELEFYLKDQVVHLADLESDIQPRLRTLRVIRTLAGEIITFLSQIENVQKCLFEKRKLVLRSDYIIPIKEIPKSFWPEISSNTDQTAQWQALFGIDSTQFGPEADDAVTIQFFETHLTLTIDTACFTTDFTYRLLATFTDLDENIDGLLIHSENYQGLRFLERKYSEQIKCFYIDPPYNTGGIGFAYKDSYQHASWLTMISERLSISYQLFTEKGVIFSSIDALERNHLENIMDSVFKRKNRVEEIIWVQNTTKNQSPTYSTNHEYVEVYAKNIETVKTDFVMFRESKPGFAEIMKLIEKLNPTYPSISEVESTVRKLYCDRKTEIAEDETEAVDEWKGIYNYNRAEYRDDLGRYVEDVDAKKLYAKIWIWREDNPSMPQVKEDSQKAEFRDPNDPTYRFYNPIHPKTGKPCPAPKRGWSWPYKPHGKQKNCFSELAADHRIAWGDDENKIPQTKRFLHEVETNVGKSVVNDYTDGEKELTNLFGKTRSFGGPKPTTLIKRFCQQVSVSKEFVCDFFAGSGTTAHAVINLNREDGGRRKFILVEMADYFDTVLLPRIRKVMYTPEWKDGQPKRQPTNEEADRTPRIIKVLRLESYEDALHNLVTEDTRTRETPRTDAIRKMVGGEAYRLSYLVRLPLEASASLLNLEAMDHPFDYRIEVLTDSGPKSQAVDLVETFNFLYGLHVERLETWINPVNRRHYRVVLARDRKRRKILVLWRDMDDYDPVIERRFLETKLLEFSVSFDECLINSDTATPGFRSLDGLFKQLLTEGER